MKMSAFDDTKGQKVTKQEKEAERLLAISSGAGDPAIAEAYAAAADEAERRRAAEMAALGTPALEHVREATDIDPDTRGAWNFRPGIDPLVPPQITPAEIARATAVRALGGTVPTPAARHAPASPGRGAGNPAPAQPQAGGQGLQDLFSRAAQAGGQASVWQDLSSRLPFGYAPAASPGQGAGNPAPASPAGQAQGLLSLPPSYYASAMLIGQQAASQPDVADTGQSPYAGGLMDYLKTLDDRLTDEERKKLARRERAGRIITALGDGIAAISDIVATNRYAPYIKREPLSERYAAMWDRFHDDLDADDGQWRDLYINAWLKDKADAAARGAAEAQRRQDIIDNSLKLGDIELKAMRDAADAANDAEANRLRAERLAFEKQKEKAARARTSKGNGKGGSGGSGDKPKPAENRRIILEDGRSLVFNINDDREAITYVSFLADAGILASNPFDALGKDTSGGGAATSIAAILSSGNISPKDLAKYGDYARAVIASVRGRQGRSTKKQDDELARRYEAATGRKATVKDLRTDASAWEDE